MDNITFIENRVNLDNDNINNIINNINIIYNLNISELTIDQIIHIGINLVKNQNMLDMIIYIMNINNMDQNRINQLLIVYNRAQEKLNIIKAYTTLL